MVHFKILHEFTHTQPTTFDCLMTNSLEFLFTCRFHLLHSPTRPARLGALTFELRSYNWERPTLVLHERSPAPSTSVFVQYERSPAPSASVTFRLRLRGGVGEASNAEVTEEIREICNTLLTQVQEKAQELGFISEQRRWKGSTLWKDRLVGACVCVCAKSK